MRITLLFAFLLSCTLAKAQNENIFTSRIGSLLTSSSATGTLIPSTGTALVITADGHLATINHGDTTCFLSSNSNADISKLFNNSQLTFVNYQSGLNAVNSDEQPLDQAALRSISQSISLVAATDENKTISSLCRNCLTLSSVAVNQLNLKSYDNKSTIGIEQQIDAGAIGAYKGDFSVWLKARSADSAQGATSLAIFTSSNSFPDNRNGTIAINLGNGQGFGISTDSVSGTVGWTNNPQGILHLAAGTVFANGNIVDKGVLTTTKLIVSDANQTDQYITNIAQAYFNSGNTSGTAIWVGNESKSPGANTGIFLSQGPYTNRLTTISYLSQDETYPPGSFVMESCSPGGIYLNALDNSQSFAGAVTIAVDNQPYIRVDANEGINILKRPFILPRATSKVLKADVDAQEGETVFNTSMQSICVYTKKGWKALKMTSIH